MDQKTRPQYYDGQYLGADDLEAIVRYARVGQARHALGAHLWGIGVGLDLVERALTGDDVEMLLTPGVAWDGYARPLVAPAPQRVGLDLFADFQDDTPSAGSPVEVWLAYRELPASPPGVGFSCPEDDLHGRVVETFRIELRRTPMVDYHAVSIASRAIEAKNALKAFDASKPQLHDESVPHQAFPESGNKPPWPIFVGMVRWRKDTGQPGRLIKRTDADRNSSRKGRHYLGVVTETIAAADGAIRLRDRGKDPADPAVNYTAPIVAAPAGATVVNDLVWCEGHLRVVGDTRLQGGKLDYRVAGGGDDQIPIYLRRIVVNAPIMKTTLDAFVAPPPLPPGPPPPPPLPQTRFTVSTTDNGGNAKECLTVVTDGRVGINSDEPSNTFEVKGPTGIRYGLGYITGDDAAGWTGLAFNAFTRPGGPWVIPPGHKPAALVLDDNTGVPEFKFQTNIAGNPASPWDVQVVIKGDTGNVGIGHVAPTAKLHVRSANPFQGDIQLFSATADVEYDGGSDKLFVFKDTGGKTAFIGGDIGVGTVPSSKVHVRATNPLQGDIQLFSATADFEYDGGSDKLFVFKDTGGKTAFVGGDVGIGTTNPATRLQVVGNRIRLGDNLKRIDLRADGSAVDVHSETDNLYLRSSGPGGKNKVIINPFAADGNVGIGTETPNSKLDVKGDLHITGDAFKDSLGFFWLASDATLKKDMKRIPNPLERLLGLKGVSFRWREPERVGAGAGRYFGFVAQDVEKVFPEWVKATPAGVKAVNPAGLEALLVEAIRELAARAERLEAEVSALRKQLATRRSAEKGAKTKTGRARKPRVSKKTADESESE
jgi:hypothetical protein